MEEPAFLDQDLSLFHKGNFELLNRDFLCEALAACRPVMAVQQKYQKLDNDSFFNELKDGMIGAHLQFDLINTHKHGLDAKKSGENVFLEVKQVSIAEKSWEATFNDTTLEKAQAFMDKKTFLAVGVWAGIAELQFIVFGQNPAIGHYLYQKVEDALNAVPSRRSTQTVSLKDLVVKYGFRIMLPTLEKNQVSQLFRMKYSGDDWWSEAFV